MSLTSTCFLCLFIYFHADYVFSDALTDFHTLSFSFHSKHFSTTMHSCEQLAPVTLQVENDLAEHVECFSGSFNVLSFLLSTLFLLWFWISREYALLQHHHLVELTVANSGKLLLSIEKSIFFGLSQFLFCFVQIPITSPTNVKIHSFLLQCVSTVILLRFQFIAG